MLRFSSILSSLLVLVKQVDPDTCHCEGLSLLIASPESSMCWGVWSSKHPGCTNSAQDFMHCPDTMHIAHAALTWQQGWSLGVETLPVLLEASPVRVLLLSPGGLHLKFMAWVCQWRCWQQWCAASSLLQQLAWHQSVVNVVMNISIIAQILVVTITKVLHCMSVSPKVDAYQPGVLQ